MNCPGSKARPRTCIRPALRPRHRPTAKARSPKRRRRSPAHRQQQQSQERPIPPQREAKEATAPRPPAPEATQAELVSDREDRARETVSIVREATCRISDGTDTGTTEHRRSCRTIRGSRRTARRRLCRAAGRHQRAWLRLDRAVSGTCRPVFEGPRGGRTRRQGQHQDTHFLQPRRHAGVSAALARAGPDSKTAGGDGKCSRCSGKMPAVHHAAGGKIQTVEDDGGLRHPPVRALVRQDREQLLANLITAAWPLLTSCSGQYRDLTDAEWSS